MSNTEHIFGRNAVYEVLRAGRRQVTKLLVAEGAREKGNLIAALQLASERGIPIQRVKRSTLDHLTDSHQGVAAVAGPYPYSTLEDILDFAARQSEPSLVLLLDIIQNPQNLGTLLRTAEAVGVHGAVLPERRGAEVTNAVVNASAGASEHLLIAHSNLARAIWTLKEHEVWIVGLERSAEAQPLGELDLSGPIGLVVGNESQGLRRLVREGCDFLLRLPQRGKVDSLNAAVAGSIALYAIYLGRSRTSLTSPTKRPT